MKKVVIVVLFVLQIIQGLFLLYAFKKIESFQKDLITTQEQFKRRVREEVEQTLLDIVMEILKEELKKMEEMSDCVKVTGSFKCKFET